MPSERPRERLLDIVENCDRVMAYTAGLTAASLASDRLRLDAVERCIERISEAAKKLGPWAEAEMPGLPWEAIRAVGNVLRHQYDDVDPEVIARIAFEDAPALRARAVASLARMD